MQAEIESLPVGLQRGQEAILGRDVSVWRYMLKRMVHRLLISVLDRVLWRCIAIVTVRAHVLKSSLADDSTTLLRAQRMKSTWFFLLKIVCDW